MTGVRQSITNPAIYEQSNIQGFTNLLELCRIHHVRKIIYASSSSVYGGQQAKAFQREDAAIDNLLNYYAVTKRMNELAAENYATLYDMQAIGLRFFTVYGPLDPTRHGHLYIYQKHTGGEAHYTLQSWQYGARFYFRR